VDEEAKAAEGGFAFDSGDEVITQLDAFNGGPKDKFAGVRTKGSSGVISIPSVSSSAGSRMSM